MKVFYIVSLFVFLGISYSYSQSKESLPVTVFKESNKIDGLMDMILKQEKLYNDEDNDLVKDSCYVIEIRKLSSYTSFQIIKNRKAVINYIINRTNLHDGNFGFFLYRGCKVFAWSDDSFFNKTEKFQTFNFAYRLESNAPQPSQQMMYEKVFHYKYQDGHFLTEGAPGVK